MAGRHPIHPSEVQATAQWRSWVFPTGGIPQNIPLCLVEKDTVIEGAWARWETSDVTTGMSMSIKKVASGTAMTLGTAITGGVPVDEGEKINTDLPFLPIGGAPNQNIVRGRQVSPKGVVTPGEMVFVSFNAVPDGGSLGPLTISLLMTTGTI